MPDYTIPPWVAHPSGGALARSRERVMNAIPMVMNAMQQSQEFNLRKKQLEAQAAQAADAALAKNDLVTLLKGGVSLEQAAKTRPDLFLRAGAGIPKGEKPIVLRTGQTAYDPTGKLIAAAPTAPVFNPREVKLPSGAMTYETAPNRFSLQKPATVTAPADVKLLKSAEEYEAKGDMETGKILRDIVKRHATIPEGMDTISTTTKTEAVPEVPADPGSKGFLGIGARPPTAAIPGIPETSTTVRKKVPAVKKPEPSPNKVIVEKDGKKFRLPEDQLEEAIKAGYKRVSE